MWDQMGQPSLIRDREGDGEGKRRHSNYQVTVLCPCMAASLSSMACLLLLQQYCSLLYCTKRHWLETIREATGAAAHGKPSRRACKSRRSKISRCVQPTHVEAPKVLCPKRFGFSTGSKGRIMCPHANGGYITVPETKQGTS